MAAKVVTPGYVAPQASTKKQKEFSSAQLAKAVQGTNAFRSASSDTNNVVKRVMIYRWTWDNLKEDEQRAKYGRDGCTRCYPGHLFVEPWAYGVDLDPGLPGFLHQHRQIFKDNTEASSKRFSNLVIGLMADDIEASEGFDPEAA
eukprot:7446009-Heterocapsa_arctica.AAC.1